MKVLITGIAGTGKSTIIEALNKRGIDAVDLHDVPDLFFWQDRRTAEKVPYAPVHSQKWFDTMERLCDLEKLKEILNQYDDIIMAGTISGDDQKQFLSLFDKIILLQANPDTLIHRMQTRINKSGYGKTKVEQDDNIAWQKEYDSLLISYGAIPVNTEGSLDEVADKIIGMVTSNF